MHNQEMVRLKYIVLRANNAFFILRSLNCLCLTIYPHIKFLLIISSISKTRIPHNKTDVSCEQCSRYRIYSAIKWYLAIKWGFLFPRMTPNMLILL